MREKVLTLLLITILTVAGATHNVNGLSTADHIPVTIVQDRTDNDEGSGYELSAASPNPFDFRTSFTVTVEERQEITVEIYNILGQHVRNLYQGVLEAEFPLTLFFEADNLPNGLYVYHVQGETFEASRKVTLLR